MVLEIVVLNVRAGQAGACEAAFARAERIISGMGGYVRHELQRCLEDDHKSALLVWWETLEDHTVGFRESSQYQEWRSLLRHLSDPFPTVEHFVRVTG